MYTLPTLSKELFRDCPVPVAFRLVNMKKVRTMGCLLGNKFAKLIDLCVIITGAALPQKIHKTEIKVG